MYSPPDYENVEIKKWKENAKEVVPLLKKGNPNLLKKISTFSKNFGYQENEVIQEILNNQMFAANFAVTPSRQQGYMGEIAFKWLQDNLNLGVVNLPQPKQKGYQPLYISSNGDIVLKKIPHTKFLDFKWKVKGYTFYAMYKYTRGSGGEQGEVSSHIKNTLRNFKNSKAPHVVLIAIIGGTYYTDEKIEEIRAETNDKPPCSYACRIEDVPMIVGKYR